MANSRELENVLQCWKYHFERDDNGLQNIHISPVTLYKYATIKEGT